MAAPPYPKIENLYARAEDGKSLDIGTFRRDTTHLITTWLATEKIDGTNIRVSLEATECAEGIYEKCGHGINHTDDWVVRFYGRTNKADMPDFLQEYLESAFALDKLRSLWRGQKSCNRCEGTGREDSGQPKWLSEVATPFPYACDCVEPYPITLYGEGYGARIQRGGGDYRRDGDVSFRLFDVLVAEKHWLSWTNIELIAQRLGIKTVPMLGTMLKEDIVSLVREGFMSYVAREEGTPRLAEGIVARTAPYLFDNNGRRVVFKTKTKDF